MQEQEKENTAAIAACFRFVHLFWRRDDDPREDDEINKGNHLGAQNKHQVDV